MSPVPTNEDASDLAVAQQALRSSNWLLEALGAHSEELVIVFDEHDNAQYSSSSLRRLLGADATIHTPEDVFRFVVAADRDLVVDLERRIRSGVLISGKVDCRIAIQIGTWIDAQIHDDVHIGRWHQIKLASLFNVDGGESLLLTMHDIHQRYVNERERYFFSADEDRTTVPDRGSMHRGSMHRGSMHRGSGA